LEQQSQQQQLCTAPAVAYSAAAAAAAAAGRTWRNQSECRDMPLKMLIYVDIQTYYDTLALLLVVLCSTAAAACATAVSLRALLSIYMHTTIKRNITNLIQLNTS
jgi:hypothetical protein